MRIGKRKFSRLIAPRKTADEVRNEPRGHRRRFNSSVQTSMRLGYFIPSGLWEGREGGLGGGFGVEKSNQKSIHEQLRDVLAKHTSERGTIDD